MRTHCRRLFAVLGVFASAQLAYADSPSVTAVLNSSEAAVGETVHLEIRVAGARGADAPENIMVDGLEIRRTGTSQRIEMNNLNLTSSVIYDYTVMPLRAGRFTIPPQTIRVGNNSLRTPALTLNVADSPGRSSGTRPGRDAAAASASSLVFAELIVPSKTAYVGEIVPVQVRMGFDPRVRPRLVEPPEITGQGFTAQKLQQSGENTETISGRPYEVVTFKTAIAAARAGKFEIGPVKAKAQVVVPRRQSAPRSRPRSPFDLLEQDDEVGLSGTKTFEMVLSPNDKKQGLPLLAFSYFDPVKEQYVTLHSEPIPINVQGGAAVAQNAGAGQSAAPTPSTGTARPPVPTATKQQDILYQLTERPRAAESFAPIYTQRVFWAAELIPLLALIGFAGWKIRRTRIDNREAQRVAALRHEATDLMHKLHRNDVSPREYYAEASRVVRLKAALASGNRRIDPNMVEVETAAETFKLNSDSRDRLRRLFEQSDEWQYSGAHNGPGRVSPESRREVLELIENLR